MNQETILISFVSILLFLIASPVLGCDVSHYCIVNETENITIRVLNETSIPVGDPIIDANCTIDIYLDNILITQGASMNYTSNGRYSYPLNNSEINETGVYDYYISVSKDSFFNSVSGSYEIVNETPLTSLSFISNSTNTTNNYIANSTSSLYSNIWSTTIRTLTDYKIVDIARAVWDETINTIRTITGTGASPRDRSWDIPATTTPENDRGSWDTEGVGVW